MTCTEKYYDDMDPKLLDITITMIKDALKYTCEKHYLTDRDINVLGRLLVYRKDGNDDGEMYEHVVDYLWMAYKIGLNQKFMLLDLLNP